MLGILRSLVVIFILKFFNRIHTDKRFSPKDTKSNFKLAQLSGCGSNALVEPMCYHETSLFAQTCLTFLVLASSFP